MNLSELQPQIDEAIKQFELTIININIPANFKVRKTVLKLASLALLYYDKRKDKRHGIALNEFVTVIISEPAPEFKDEKPIFNIYYNLSSGWYKRFVKDGKQIK